MQQHTNQQPQTSAPQTPAGKNLSWVTVAATLGKLTLLYLAGPAPFRAVTLRKEIASGQPYHAERRWEDHTAAAVLLPLVLYGSLWHFHEPFTWAWSGLFASVASWIHFPLFAALGQVSLFPPTPGNLLFRWLLAWPCVPLIARLLEQHEPITRWEAQRVVTEDDRQTHQNILAEEAAERKAKQVERAALRAEQATRAPRTRIKPPDKPKTPYIPPKTSLWGQVDWNKVDDTNPLKQQTLATAQEVQLACYETERIERGKRDKERTERIVDALPPTSPPPATRPEDEDWGSGDSSIKL